MKYTSFAVLDFETGGFNAQINPITQVAVVMVDGKTLEKKVVYSNYVKPYDNTLVYEQAALDYCHITMSMLIDRGVELEKIVKDLCVIFSNILSCNDKKYRSLLVGQNITFDIPFLVDIFNRCKEDLSKYFKNTFDDKNFKKGDRFYSLFYPQHLDTLNLSLVKYGDNDKVTALTLTHICQLNDVELSEAHDAKYDTIATADVFIIYVKQLRSSSTSSGAVGDNKVDKIRYRFPI